MIRSKKENRIFPTDLTKVELKQELLTYSEINNWNTRMKELGNVLLAQNELHNRQTSKMVRISILLMVIAVLVTVFNTIILVI